MSRIKPHLHFWFLATFFCLAAIPSFAQTNAASTLPELIRQLQAHVSDARFSGALWGVKIISLDSGKTVFEDHADRLMSPASNSKLYTGALALEALGPEYRIVTPILASKRPNSRGTLRGDLVIAGRADPTWNIRYAGLNFWDLFEPFVTAIKKAGVRRVTGDLVADATFLHSPPNGSGWAASDLEDYYGAEISALTIDDNYTQIGVKPAAKPGAPCVLRIVDPCTGLQLDNQTTTTLTNVPKHLEAHRFPGKKIVHVFGHLPIGNDPEMIDMAVPRPAEWFAAGLKEALRRNGIKVHGTARAVFWPASTPNAAVKLGEVVSPPLSELVRDFMKPSQNLEADLIFEHAGEMMRSTNTPVWGTSEDLALHALHDFFATNGLPADEVHFDEGSGLSRNNLTTANATVSLLQFMSKQRAGKDFVAALPLAGVDGTLRRRMRDTPAAHNVQAKTGTLRWANSLSGFVTTAAGEHLAFSLMLNRYASPSEYRKSNDLDDMVVALARFSGHVEEPLAARYAASGTLIVTQFVNAPFPHPARAEGRTYHGEFFSAKEHYSDSTVAMFVPKDFRPTDKIDFIVHFHGWRHEVAGTLEEYRLIQQLAHSGKNAVLIVPQGPYMAPDSFGGKLEDTNGFAAFMDEAVEKLRDSGALATSKFQIGNIILSCHSGGYHVVAAILDHGGLQEKIREVWLFDALYGNDDNFVSWQKNQNGRLLDVYTDHGGTSEETEKLMALYKSNNTDPLAAEEGAVGTEALQTNKLVFLHSDLPHDDVIASHRTFEQFIQSSCLQDK
ncbi:MAG TPA: D-alanyl-D-alanine carboxypeptidase/D-alanyl-D-alanine-endopeptidase [Candidatus Angelobacter sp.]|nr:D-alanyl-D-alanine carboxypeptidase/D-alanyl-D-alanine-endopeptidase [Candidatus Angelobacter sp.]